MMEITEVKVFPVHEEKLRAFVSVVIDRCFMVNDIKVIQGRDGLFISMPSRRKRNGDFKDIAHPLNNDTRCMIEDRILSEYEGTIGKPVERRPRKTAPVPPADRPQAREAPVAQEPALEAEAPLLDAGEKSLDEVQEQHLSDSFWTVG